MNEEENSLEKEMQEKNMKDQQSENKDSQNTEEKEEIIVQQNEKDEKEFSDDDLDHPNALDSDYYEETKEEIKKSFYNNKLKEKVKKKEKEKNKIYQKNNKDFFNNNALNENNAKLPLKEMQKLEINNNNSMISIILSGNSNRNSIKKEKPKNVEKSEKQILEKEKKGNLFEIKRDNFYLENGFHNKSEFEEKLINKEALDNNNVNKGNMNFNIISNNSIEIRNINQYKDKENNKNQNNEQINSNKKAEQLNKVKQIPKDKNEKLSKIPQKLIKKRVPSYQSNSNNQVVKPIKKLYPNKIVNKINKSINNNSVITINNILDNNNQKESINLQNPKYNRNNIQDMHNYSSNTNNHKQNMHSENKGVLRPLGAKSLSYSKIPLNDNISQLTKNINPLKEKDLNSNGNINRFHEKKEDISQIPIQIGSHIENKQKNNNKDIIKIRSSKRHFSVIPSRKNYNTINSININNIHNNYFFKDEEKENIQNNTEYKKTFQKGGQFNNIQTTHIIMPKTSNSKSKLIPTINNSIDFESNKYLFPTKSVMHIQPTKYYQEQKHNYLNTDNNINYNRNISYLSTFPEKLSSIQNTSTIQRIKNHGITLDIQKINNEHSLNQYHCGLNTKYLECAKNLLNNLEKKNNNSLIGKYHSININTNNENYDYYNCRTNPQTNNSYHSYTLNNRYPY